jgi:uncharacterized protein (TIGR02466 family)
MEQPTDTNTNTNTNKLMQKKMSNIFSTYILGYDNPNFVEQNKMIIDLMGKEEFHPGDSQPFQTVDNHLEKRPEFAELFNWINDCLEDYRQTFVYNCDSFKPILAWINKATQEGQHNPHVHPMSFLSAVYYISDNCTPTYFEDPKIQARSGWMVGSHSPAMSSVWQCPSETGTLVIFPSYLSHYTESINSSPYSPKFDGYRYTMSFNAIPFGVSNKGSLLEFNYNG